MATKALLTLALATASLLANGQACTPPEQTPVVSYPSGTILSDVGSTDMPISTKSNSAKAFAKQGFALIHCFWPNEAIRSFRDATKADPTCAIAWCGLNIALTQPWFDRTEYRAEAEYAIKQAIANIESASEPEQELIRAFRLRAIGKDDRNSDFEKAMETLVQKHFGLDEPRLLWAGLRAQLCMSTSYMPNGDPRGDLEFVAKLIEPVIGRSKSPGAMHYWIHAYEPTQPKLAEKAADDLYRVAKGSPHMVHMAGHIYNRIGRYEDGQKVFQRAREMDEALGRQFKVPPGQAIWQYQHNVVFQGKNLLELARINEAIELSKIDRNLRLEIAARVGDWKNAYDPKRNDAEYVALNNTILARIDLETNNVAAARAKVDTLLPRLSKPEPKGWAKTSHLLNLIDIHEINGLVLAAEGKFEAAIDALRSAVKCFRSLEYEEPVFSTISPFESLGAILIQAKRYDEAVAAYQDGLKERPNSGWLLFGVARAHEEAGRGKEAAQAYKVFLKAWATADKDRPELKRANDFLASVKH